jgi:hypothetical protein
MFGHQFVSDVKSVLNAAFLFLLYPPFWALFDQQGSKWTFQVTIVRTTFALMAFVEAKLAQRAF